MTSNKQFGIWMDTHEATIVGNTLPEGGDLTVLALVKGENISPNSSEKTEHNQERSLQLKFFKEIASHLTNATYVHITGTGIAQEKFIHFLAETPQFKNTKTDESTNNKMTNDRLLEFMQSKLN